MLFFIHPHSVIHFDLFLSLAFPTAPGRENKQQIIKGKNEIKTYLNHPHHLTF